MVVLQTSVLESVNQEPGTEPLSELKLRVTEVSGALTTEFQPPEIRMYLPFPPFHPDNLFLIKSCKILIIS